ncbi:MAG: leucyl aminopeptidase [Azoarcus sp.]|nr:leucyl aminopeptidase [Azoarcus sp.]
MEFTIKTAPAEKVRTGLLVLAAFADGALPPSTQLADEASQGKLSALVASGELAAKPGATLLLHGVAGVVAERVLLVRLGKRETFADKPWRDALAAAAKAIADTLAKDAVVALDEAILPPDRDLPWALRQASRIVADGAYRFKAPRADKKEARAERKKHGAHKVAFLVADGDAACDEAVRQGEAIAAGMALAKTLGNLGANVCTPSYLADAARALAKEHPALAVDVLDRGDMEKLGMGALLAVARGARQSPRFIVLRYDGLSHGKTKDKSAKTKTHPVVLVGKGITFDSGGISIKPSADMDEMKYDMCGAASVIGVIAAIAQLRLPLDVVGLVPATENMPGGDATRPGDVVRSLSGQTIEIVNTDAEGRLILCDALTYAERFKPACVIDVATLTGACIVALGKIPSGLFANDDELADTLTRCGEDSGDRVWRLPLWDEYQDLLKSNFADMLNTGGRNGGASTAAVFLSRFAKSYKWAHLDIAGTAWISGENKGSTARPLPLLAEFLIERAAGRQ